MIFIVIFGGTLDLNGYDLRVTGDFYCTGTLNLGSGTLTVDGSIDDLSGTIDAGTSLLKFNHPITETFAGNTDDLYDVEFAGGGLIYLNGNLNVSNNINIFAGTVTRAGFPPTITCNTLSIVRSPKILAKGAEAYSDVVLNDTTDPIMINIQDTEDTYIIGINIGNCDFSSSNCNVYAKNCEKLYDSNESLRYINPKDDFGAFF